MPRSKTVRNDSSDEQNKSAVYIARQPIFNTAGTVYAYELLYRDTEQNAFNPDIDDEFATKTVISESILNFGMRELTNDKKAFVNFSQGSLLHRAAYLLDPDQFVIEILETVVFTPSVLDALYTLKAAGFMIALDDYTGASLTSDVLYLIDIIKIDFQASTRQERASFVDRLNNQNIRLLAEKVETVEDVEEALALGCELFQGYFYSKPTMLKKSNREISTTSYFKLSKELCSTEVNLNRLAWIIHWDAHLTYKLLRKMKTLQYYRGNPITSIKRALVMMGEEEVRRWIMLVLIREVADTRSDELIRTALIRGFMCERLARESRNYHASAESFSTGILSIIQYDDIREIEQLQIPDMIKEALSGADNILKRFLDISVNYENGNWEMLDKLITPFSPSLDMRVIPGLYFMSVSSADEMLAKEELDE